MQALITELSPLVQELERVERQIEILEYERQALRQRLTDQMHRHQQKRIVLAHETFQIQLQLQSRSTIQYHDDVLRQRLGARYLKLLSPDTRKLRQHEEAALALLQPILTQIGKVSRHRVQLGFETGVFQRAEFEGAYERNNQNILIVKKLPQKTKISECDPY